VSESMVGLLLCVLMCILPEIPRRRARASQYEQTALSRNWVLTFILGGGRATPICTDRAGW